MRGLGIAVAITTAVSGSAHGETLAPAFVDDVSIDHLDTPVAFAFAPTGEVFVAEKAGRVKMFAPLPSPGAGTVVLDLRTQVASFQDRGMLGLAVDPGYPLVPYVYVLYTYDAPPGDLAPVWNDTCGGPGQPNAIAPGHGCVVSGRLARYTLLNGQLVDETVMIADAWYQQYGSHSVGDLAFGPDGNLYVSAGEGANYQLLDDGDAHWISFRDPDNDDPVGLGGSFRSLDLLTPGDPVGLSGAVLRLDPATGAAAADNPLPGDAARIIAFGLRNPFRFAFRPGTPEMWIGDVGMGAYEEVDVIRDVGDAVVEDFGWPCYEGPAPVPDFASISVCQELAAGTLPPGTPGTLTPPVTSYLHGHAPAFDAPTDPCVAGAGNAIVGLGFYAGTEYPVRLSGDLVFADYAVGCMYAAPIDPAGMPDLGRLEVLGRAMPHPVAVASGPDGDLYYASLDGAIRHLRYTGHAPTAIATANITSGASPLPVTFDGSASTDPDGQAIAYAWDLDGDGEFDDGTAAQAAWTYDTGVHRARLRVTDTDGKVSVSAPIVIAVDVAPPVVAIDAPLAGQRWRAGDAIAFSGHASDRSGPLPPAALHWQITLMHCPGGGCHPHPFESFDGVASGSFVTAPDGYPSRYVVALTATSPSTLEATVEVTIDGEPPPPDHDRAAPAGAEVSAVENRDGGCSSGGTGCSYVLLFLLTFGRFGLTNWSYQSCRPSPSSNRNRKPRPPRSPPRRSIRCSRSCSRTSSAASTPRARGSRPSAS